MIENKGVRIHYGDVAAGAKENFVPTITNVTSFSNIGQIMQEGLTFENYGNPCEYGHVILDGKSLPLPKDLNNVNIGCWSDTLFEGDYGTNNPVILTVTAPTTGVKYTSIGIAFEFDVENNIFPTALNIKWYSYNATSNNYDLLSDKDFAPNEPYYLCQNTVRNYDKIVVTFQKMNMPNVRLRLRRIDFGYNAIFTPSNLNSVSVIQELSPYSDEIPANAVDFNVSSKKQINYSFSKMQKIRTYFNDTLLNVTFVSNAQKTSRYTWEVESEDYIAVLAKVNYMGGIYNNTPINTILNEIFTAAEVPYTLDESLTNIKITGYLPICTCQEALRQVCFAAKAVCNTAYADKPYIESLPDVSHTLDSKHTAFEPILTDIPTVSSVKLTAHSYKLSTNEADKVEAYSAADDGIGDRITVEFSQPLDNLSITHGEILKDSSGNLLKNVNYAIIKANTGCVLTGFPYVDTKTVKTKENPNFLPTETKQEIEVEDATLINTQNQDDILNNMYTYLTKEIRYTVNAVENVAGVKFGTFKFGERKFGEPLADEVIKVGETLIFPTRYSGQQSGIITSQRYSCNGFILRKECEVI